MTSTELNEAIHELPDDLVVPCFGIGWRDVDWDAETGTLAVASEQVPSWFHLTLEHQLRRSWTGRSVRFCENNKWGYHEFEVDGVAWRRLRERVEAHVARPTVDTLTTLALFLDAIAPADAEVDVP